MTQTTHTYRSQIAASVAAVRAWHSNPSAFERLTPPWMDVRVLDGVGGIAPGDWKRLRVAAGPIGVSWTLVHGNAEDGTGFVDEQTDGPFQSWRHEHRFLNDGRQRSVLEDRITYQLPFGSISQLVAGRQFERRLDDLFRFRHRRTQVDLARHNATGLARPQRIAISGASGLVGTQLVPFLRAGGHDIARLVRRRPSSAEEISWDPATGRIDAASLEGMDAVIHLAGVSIAGGRWTSARKAAILSSRLQGTTLLSETLASLQRPPRVLISASGIGYYGDAGSTPLTEESPLGAGFLAGVCRDWEEATAPAAASGIRVVLPRFGVVLAGGGGLLARLTPAFRFGFGGPLGSGEQFMSWIALDDLLGVLLQAIADDRLAGPVNAVAPQAVSNRAFAETLGRVLNRPAVLRAPASALRLVARELADELLLASQLAQPARLEEVGFSFAFPTLEDTLRHELGRVGEHRGAGVPWPMSRAAVQPSSQAMTPSTFRLVSTPKRWTTLKFSAYEERFVLESRLIIGIRTAMAALLLVISGLSVGGVMAQAVEVEQPTYEVVSTVGPIEIRHYGPRLAAEADMRPGSGIETEQGATFMALAGFIFGQNRQGPEVAMTAPVSIEQVTAPIAMTAPVAVEPAGRGRVMRFFMPAEYTLETLPRPGDDRVRIVTVPAQTLAVLRFSGEADDEQVAARIAELLAALEGSNWEPVGEPGFFGYDPPMTPPELRRNEVFVEVAAVSSAMFHQARHGRPA